MPRLSSAELEGLSFGDAPPRLAPPGTLGELERRAFTDLILSVPSTQFRPSDLPLICRWAELTVMCEQAAGELAAGGMVTGEGASSPWLAVYEKVTKLLLQVSARLHLSPSARGHAVFSATAEPPVSYYDRQAMLLEGDGDGTDRDGS